MTLDALHRRSRFERHSTGKHVEPTPRSLVWFEKLAAHGPLPIEYLHAFTAARFPKFKNSQKHAGDLYHEHTTDHGGPYLDRLEVGGFRSELNSPSIYDLNPRSLAVLEELGRLHDNGIRATTHQGRSREGAHRLMTACVTASLDLACTRSGLRYIPQWEIVSRMPERENPLRIPVSFEHAGALVSKPVVPDALFGIEYPDAGFRIFALEIDRANEPLAAANLNRTSFLRKVLQYRALIGDGHYKAHFGMKKAKMQLIVITTGPLQGMLALAEKTAGPTTYMLFARQPEFGRRIIKAIPPPMTHLLTTPYLRAGCEPFNISTP